jgi:indole-3-glycerol phosphate synthase
LSWRPPRGVLGELVASAAEDARARRRAAAGAGVVPSRPAGRFVSALTEPRGTFPLICEVKRASPSAGSIRSGVDAPALAQAYVSAGARCVSVLTEARRFGGSLRDLAEVRAAVDAPLLRKDFVVDPWMVQEAAAHGADCVLLIVAAVDPVLLRELAQQSAEAGLDVLLELIFERDLDALEHGPWPLVGINARDLETLEVDADRFSRLAPRAAAPGRLLVAESGVTGPSDIARFASQGAGAALVGEALVRAPDPGALVRSLAAGAR